MSEPAKKELDSLYLHKPEYFTRRNHTILWEKMADFYEFCVPYDVLNTNVAFVFARYLIKAIERWCNEYDWTLGEIFYYFMDELADITFVEYFQIIMIFMRDSISSIFQPTEE